MPEKTLAEKLLINSGRNLALINPPRELSGILPSADVHSPEKSNILLAFIKSRNALLDLLPKLETLVKTDGIVWIAYPKLTSKQKTDINRDSINAQAKLAGWMGVAMIAIDETWSALRIRPL